MYAFVDSFGGCFELLLDVGSELDTLFHILVLEELEYDVAL